VHPTDVTEASQRFSLIEKRPWGRVVAVLGGIVAIETIDDDDDDAIDLRVGVRRLRAPHGRRARRARTLHHRAAARRGSRPVTDWPH
jgi:hypothetical protein